MQSFVHYLMLIFKVTFHLLDGYHFNLLIYEERKECFHIE